jgi:tetratricopeptide (TPR) repeat protein
LNRASHLDPGNPQAEYQKALIFLGAGLHEAARRALLKVLDIAPGEPAVLMHLGKACKHLGLLQEAVRGPGANFVLVVVCIEFPTNSRRLQATHLNAALGRCASNDKQSNIIKGMLHSLSTAGDDGDVVY